MFRLHHPKVRVIGGSRLWRFLFTSPRGFKISHWVEDETKEEAEAEARKWVPEGSTLKYFAEYTKEDVKELLKTFSRGELEAVSKGTPCSVEVYLNVFHTKKVPILVQDVARELLKES